MALNSLKELSQWHLNQLVPSHYLNSFVSCGILYTLAFTKTQFKENDTKNKFLNGNTLDYDNWQLRRNFQLSANNSVANNININAVFDFNTEQYINPPRLIGIINYNDFIDLTGETMLSISNVQYDAISDSLNIFNNGKIYSILLKRKRF